MKEYWVIYKTEHSDCGHRWAALPATEDTLKDAVDIAKACDGKVFCATQWEEHKPHCSRRGGDARDCSVCRPKSYGGKV